MDMQLAAYKARKFRYVPPKGVQPVFARRSVATAIRERSDLDDIVKRMRHDTYRRAESHNKQVQHFLNRERYAQNATWQGEYDRLLSATDTAPGLQPFVDARLEGLKALLV